MKHCIQIKIIDNNINKQKKIKKYNIIVPKYRARKLEYVKKIKYTTNALIKKSDYARCDYTKCISNT